MQKKYQRFHDVQKLIEQIKESSPSTGEYLYNYKIDILKQKNITLSSDQLRKILKLNFKDLPISHTTSKQLQKNNFHKLTEIQRCVIPHALAGRDILAASKTGSGKTLSFVIPIIENLYRKKWTVLDGLGALIILPTRELAIQVFEVLKSLLEKGHDLTLGLLIGGKDIELEKNVINRMNILVCTPGRLLQHINESFNLNLDNLQIVVLDEADEILSKGFQNTLEAIFEMIPINKTQNMLFSATLSKNIQNLSKLTLKNQENILLHQKNQEINDQKTSQNIYEIPDFLKQYYLVISHQEKLDQLFSFLKSHRNSKILVFVSTVKQVRFIYETFQKLKIGIPIFEYHGRQQQAKRMAVFYNFKEKKNGVLITTNISSRGLDIPMIKWVVQMDCPDSLETYIHRIGRTARFSKKGKSVLFVDPSEIKFIENLQNQKYQIDKIQVNPQKQLTIQQSLQAYCAENEDIKYLAQRYFISFLKSIFKMKNKEIFNIKKINYKELCKSLGLIQIPQVIIGGKTTTEQQNNQQQDQGQQLTRQQRKLQRLKDKFKLNKNNSQIDNQALKKNLGDKLATTRENKNIERSQKIINIQEDDDDFLKPKKSSIVVDKLKINPLKISKRQLGKIKPGGVFNQENMFDIDDEGNMISTRENQQQIYQQNLTKNETKDFNMLQKRQMELKETDIDDKQKDKQRIINKRTLKKKYNQFQQWINFTIQILYYYLNPNFIIATNFMSCSNRENKIFIK